MSRKTLLLAAGAWVALAVAAVANGILREAVLVPVLGEAPAQVVSMLILLAAIAAGSALLVRRAWSGLPTRALLAIGTSWAAGSVLFEFALGRLVLGMPWSDLLAQYDVLAGSLWPLAPLTMLVAPALARRLLAARAGRRARSSG